MRSPLNGTTRISSNALDSSFLRRLDGRDEPPTASEAEVAGVAAVHPVPGRGFCLYLPGARPGLDRVPVASFTDRSRALLAAAVLSGTGREPAFRLQHDPGPDGFALIAGVDPDGNPDVVGHLRLFDEALASALHVADALMRSPECLALLLEAVGKVALERAGAILDERVPPAEAVP
jgi:hypothetical protein